jgi:hypothetical protein
VLGEASGFVPILGVDRFPEDSLARTVPFESKQSSLLVAIQAANGVVQTLLGIAVGVGRQGVVDAGRPPLFLEGD